MSAAIRRLFPHELLLLACADTCPDVSTRGQVDAALSASGLDWPEVVRGSIQHGFAALLARHLRQFPDDPRIPASITTLLERIYRAQAARNHAMFTAAGCLIRALDQAGIPCLVLKGVGLAAAAYPDTAMRTFADIDILVSPARWEQAGRVAAEIGFQQNEEEFTPQDYNMPYTLYVPEDILSETLAPEFDPKHRPEALGDAVHHIVVEIHRSVFNRPGGFAHEVDMQPFWENARTVALPDGTPIRIPAPEAMLTHLASHAAHHGYWRLLFVVDMVQVIRTWETEIDWDLLVVFADRCFAKNAVYRMLEFAHREFGAAVPHKVLRRLEPGTNAGPEGEKLEPSEIFDAMELGVKELSALVWKQLLRERSFGAALVSGARILFPSPSVMRRYYHVQSPALIAVCYFIRPWQLAGRLARVIYRCSCAAWTKQKRPRPIAAPDPGRPGDYV